MSVVIGIIVAPSNVPVSKAGATAVVLCCSWFCDCAFLSWLSRTPCFLASMSTLAGGWWYTYESSPLLTRAGWLDCSFVNTMCMCRKKSAYNQTCPHAQAVLQNVYTFVRAVGLELLVSDSIRAV
jgi:hypothetical protein